MSGDAKSTIVDRPSSPPRPPRTAATTRYESGDEIGRGGMGRVVEATDTLLDRRVAVKEALTTDPELLRRFARETKITAKLEHPSIVPVYDAGVVDGHPYYVMRRVTGRPLSELIREASSLDKRLALVPHLLAAAQAIAHAHGRGIIHRDIKPGNILVGELGETVVIDWGLAKVIGEPDDGEDAPSAEAGASLQTRVGSVFGTPGFMAPDQLRGEPVGPQGDVYALGASLYNLLAGEPPHYCGDSTRMMQRAAEGPPVPIATRVPGVPRELSTIVDTALDYDSSRRYRDAGAFAEDLKRFLAGQLVASHRYSTAERVVRFVRKHRAAVAIASGATVLLVVIGSIAVSQVVGERDRADAQARLAVQGRREAEAARAMADERAELLLLSRARALVETNPTAALASLKLLPPEPRLLDEARAIANAARVRGVAWAIKGPEQRVTLATLDQTGRRLALATVDGRVHITDLETRRTVSLEAEKGIAVRWILDGTHLLVGRAGPTRILDVTGAEVPSALPELVAIEVDAAGHHGAGVGRDGRALRIDFATGAITPLPITGARVAQLSPDGEHVAVSTDDELVVFDRAGRPVVRHPHGSNPWVQISNESVAMIDDRAVLRAQLAPGAKWIPLVTHLPPNARPMLLQFSGSRLYVLASNAYLLTDAGGYLTELGRMDFASGALTHFGADYLAVGAHGRKIVYVDEHRMRSLQLPIEITTMRLVGRHGQPRIIAVGDGAIVVLELDRLPRRLPLVRFSTVVFVTDDVLATSAGVDHTFSWYDVTTDTRTPFEGADFARVLGLDRNEGRLLLEDLQPGTRASVYRASDPRPTDIVTGPYDRVTLVAGGTVAYTRGDRVFGGADRSHRELVTTDGPVRLIAGAGPARVVAVTDRELVRVGIQTGVIERIPLPAGPPVTFLHAQRGDAVLARGQRLLRWRSGLEEMAEFGAAIEELFGTEAGVLVRLDDGSTLFVANDGVVTRLTTMRSTTLARDSRLIMSGPQTYEVVELPSRARWSLPIIRPPIVVNFHIELSPSGDRLVEKTPNGRLWLWELPKHDVPLASMVEDTNFVEDRNGVILWPWQTPAP